MDKITPKRAPRYAQPGEFFATILKGSKETGLVALARWAIAQRASRAPQKAGRSVLRRFTAKVLTDRFANRQQKGPKQPDDTRDLLAKLRLR
jgi:hypothetical protein